MRVRACVCVEIGLVGRGTAFPGAQRIGAIKSTNCPNHSLFVSFLLHFKSFILFPLCCNAPTWWCVCAHGRFFCL